MALVVDRPDLLFELLTKSLNKIRDVLAVIGLSTTVFICGKSLFHLWNGFRLYVLPKLRTKSENLSLRYGQWAVVTGCTDGIGQAFALELAKRNMNIVLIARNYNKLVLLSEKIEKTMGVNTLTIQVDFSYPNQLTGILSQIQCLDIGILVNNVGIIQKEPLYLADVTDDMIHEYFNVNMLSVVAMSRMILPIMVKNRKGAIINLSSYACNLPFPYYSLYSASKAFIDHFSEALAIEYQSYDIKVQSLIPMGVATPLLKSVVHDMSSSLSIPEPSVYVQSAIETLGKSPRTTGYWSHSLTASLLGFLPKSLLLQMMMIKKPLQCQ